jgi:cyclopropane-fatty-acyl-phospholipid synthase
MVTDIEVLRLHYAETLAEWRRRFRGNWREIQRVYDDRFCRMWEFYLAGSEMGFRNQDLVVFQIQLAKRNDTLPITRDYMVDWERAHAPNVTALGRERNAQRTNVAWG